MPWQAIDSPSLPVALLRARLAQVRPDDEVAEYHGYLRWADYLLAQTGGASRPADYLRVAEGGIFDGLGDWVFSGALYDDPAWGADLISQYAARRDLDISHVMSMRQIAGDFIDSAAREIQALGADVVGFSTTFMQNVASLALARRLKQLQPSVIVVFGGGNCDGPMGYALHRNHEFIDFIVRGEGELAFPELLDRIDQNAVPCDVAGLCWRDNGKSAANDDIQHPLPPAMIPRPDFACWQAELEQSLIYEYVEPQLVLEGARGCWWGEKHQCTFCGLNGSFIQFRSRPADRVWDEINDLVARHRILDIVMVDNIIEMGYFRDLLPRLAEAGWDLRLHYEVKSNLKPEQVALLAAVGAVHVQPGIESLSSRVLKLMDKGATGAINVALLRESENHGLTVTWNYLYGFPGETESDYEPIIAQLPALSHLQPPLSATRITLERFSPYFEQPDLGFRERSHAEFYDHVYALPAAEIDDLAYMFDTPPCGIRGDIESELVKAVELWHERYQSSRLIVSDAAQKDLVIEDERDAWPHRLHHLSGWRAGGYRVLERGRTAAALSRELTRQGCGPPAAELDSWLRGLADDGLVFADSDVYVALATRAEPIKMGRR